MLTSEITYQGNLRTDAVHVRSGTSINTDGPVDNHGKGEAFSPTDLVATALASCMLSIMGIISNRHELDIVDAKASVQKVMTSNPRRIAEIHVTLDMPPKNYSEKERKLLEKAARTCPVALSIHPDTKQVVHFNW